MKPTDGNSNQSFRARGLFFSLVSMAMLILIPPDAGGLPFPGRTPANKLTPTDTADGDHFGFSAAAYGDRAVVGAFRKNDGGSRRGAAYVYDLNAGTELRKLTASDAEDLDQFGQAVGISGSLIVVGANGEDGAGVGNANRGAAYVFDLNTGAELFKLSASDTEDDDVFGFAVAISGNLIIVGAHGEDGGGLGNALWGAAYIFDLDNPNIPNPAFPNQLHENRKLTASDPANDDQLGYSVAISGNLAIAGAYRKSGGGDRRGAAYIFDATTGEELLKLTASDAEDVDQFGNSVAISGNYVVAGANGEDGSSAGNSNRGAAYLFDLTGPVVPNPANPSEIHENRKLAPSDTADDDHFGYSAGISGDLAVIGAFRKGEGGDNRGAAYVFDLKSGMEMFKVTASDGEDLDQFGVSVAISGRRVIAGANGEEGDGIGEAQRGAAYVFDVPLYQPDNLIGPRPFTGLGDGIYNSDAFGQTLSLTSRKLRPLKAWLTVQNDGDIADDYRIEGSAGNRFFAVAYLRRIANRKINVTAAVKAGNHIEPNLVPEEPGRLIFIEIRPSKRLRKMKKTRRGTSVGYLRKRYTLSVTTSSETLEFQRDTAAINAQTR